MMNVDAQLQDEAGAPMENDFHLARISIADLNGLALAWRIRAQRGDRTTAAIARALTSVARRRHAAAVARACLLAAYDMSASLRKVAARTLRR
jgi:hypothetical protein